MLDELDQGVEIDGGIGSDARGQLGVEARAQKLFPPPGGYASAQVLA